MNKPAGPAVAALVTMAEEKPGDAEETKKLKEQIRKYVVEYTERVNAMELAFLEYQKASRE